MTDETIRRLRHPATAAFLLALLACLLVALVHGSKPFYYDAGRYWLLSETFVRNDHFSLLNFENSGIRGYALPLIFFVLRNIGEALGAGGSLTVGVFNAVLFALTGAVLAPRLAAIAWPGRQWNIPRRLALTALLLVFWSGYLSYPLSDFPALAVALLALVAISSVDSPSRMLIAGVAAGIALNVRPAYLLLAPLLVLLVVWSWRDQRGSPHASNRRRALCLGFFVTGLALVCLPQSLSQHRHFDSYSPIPGSSDLTAFQYRAGLKFQRYETFVGGPRSMARMTYFDHTTDGIRDEIEYGKRVSTGEYLGIIAQHPITMAGVFLRHIVNGLDLRYRTPYVESLESKWHRPLRLAGFLLVFFALVRILWPAARRSLSPARWRYPAALLAACVTSIPSAIEARFFLPVFLLCSMIVLAPGWPTPIGPAEAGLRRYRTPALIAGSGAIFLFIVWTIVSSATDSLILT